MARHTRNKINALLHFVWATFDRLPLISEDVERELHRYIEQVARDNGCDVLAVGGMPDHIHLFVNLSTTASLAQLMKNAKGGSSRLMSKTLKPDGWVAWQGSYAVFSVAIRDKQKVIRYINAQKRHHAEGSIWPEAEQTGEDEPPT